MNPAGSLKLISQVRDLQIIDSDGHNCGIVDDIELQGRPGQPLTIKAILVGPGAYGRRLPGWMRWAVQRLAGKRVVRVPWAEVARITSEVTLRSPAHSLGLMAAEDAARRYVPKGGAI